MSVLAPLKLSQSGRCSHTGRKDAGKKPGHWRVSGHQRPWADLPAPAQEGDMDPHRNICEVALGTPHPGLAPDSEAGESYQAGNQSPQSNWVLWVGPTPYSICGCFMSFCQGWGSGCSIWLFTRKFIFTELVLMNNETFKIVSELGCNQLTFCFWKSQAYLFPRPFPLDLCLNVDLASTVSVLMRS